MSRPYQAQVVQPTCRELAELVTAYLDGVLSESEREGFEAHLAECRDCAVHLEQMRRTIAELGQLPPEELSDSERDELLVAFRGWVE
jgi:anti-sigma factor RsiW